MYHAGAWDLTGARSVFGASGSVEVGISSPQQQAYPKSPYVPRPHNLTRKIFIDKTRTTILSVRTCQEIDTQSTLFAAIDEEYKEIIYICLARITLCL